MKEGSDYGEFVCKPDAAGGLMLARQHNEEILQLTAGDREELLTYLVEHYFLTTEIESWYQARRKKAESGVHESFLKKHHSLPGMEEEVTYAAHPKESRYHGLRLVFSVLFYCAAGGALLLYNEAVLDYLPELLLLGVAGLGLFFLLRHLVTGYFLGLVKGNSVRIGARQLPELYQIVEKQSKALQLAEVPHTYLVHGSFNAFVFKFMRSKVLVLQSEVVETLLNGQEDVLAFVIGHELGHIKQKHLNSKWWLAPAYLVPLLSKAYSRGCEFTCDRIGYHFSPEGAVKGILILTVGSELYSRIDAECYTTDFKEDKSSWSWISEKFQAHPRLGKRLCEIKHYNQYK
ncbi:M48 family metallopeptidase [Cesiribacter sp. SM1]|uniref:M48 family metallopeptidase n=1 Tax=Cesiribacter sp. SM1 TaxID=2861196 RepID=UPI001CD50FE7